jgi:catalase
MSGQAEEIKPARPPIDLPRSPALSLVEKARPTLRGRKIGILVTDTGSARVVDSLREALAAEGATLEVVAPKIGASDRPEEGLSPDHALAAAPSIFFDAVVVAPSTAGAKALARDAAAVDWVRDAFGHLKVIGHVGAAKPLLERAGVEIDEGVVDLAGKKGVATFIKAAKGQRVWTREAR